MNNFLPCTFFYVVHNGKIVLQIFQSGFFVVCEINRDYTSAQVNFWMRTEDLGPAAHGGVVFGGSGAGLGSRRCSSMVLLLPFA